MRRDVVALTGALVLVAVPTLVWWKISSSADPAAFVAVSGGYLAPWWRSHYRSWWLSWGGGGEAAPRRRWVLHSRLAEGMFGIWRQEARDRQISTPAPARVRWQWADVTTHPAELAMLPEAGTGSPASTRGRFESARRIVGSRDCDAPPRRRLHKVAPRTISTDRRSRGGQNQRNDTAPARCARSPPWHP